MSLGELACIAKRPLVEARYAICIISNRSDPINRSLRPVPRDLTGCPPPPRGLRLPFHNSSLQLARHQSSSHRARDGEFPLDRVKCRVMITTTSTERELTALAEMRLRWRGRPEVVELIDAAMTTLTDLANVYGSDPIEGIDADALRLASLVHKALATVS
jgi:hypothetical protein